MIQDTWPIYKNQLPFIYTSNKQSEKGAKKIPFSFASKRIKYLGVNSIKVLQNLHSESYKVLLEEVKEGLKKWKSIPYSLIRRFNMVKMEYTSKWSRDSMQSPS